MGERLANPIDGFLDNQYAQFEASRPYLLENGPYRCTFQEEEGTFFFIQRNGPFPTTGGEDWTSMWFSNLGGLDELPDDTPQLYLTNGGFLAMTGSGASPGPGDKP